MQRSKKLRIANGESSFLTLPINNQPLNQYYYVSHLICYPPTTQKKPLRCASSVSIYLSWSCGGSGCSSSMYARFAFVQFGMPQLQVSCCRGGCDFGGTGSLFSTCFEVVALNKTIPKAITLHFFLLLCY